MPSDILIRELTSADQWALRFMFGRLSDDSRYQRFLSAKRELRASELRQLTAVDHWHHEALIAYSPPPRAPIAVAHYYRAHDFDMAELAVTVVDGWQHRGIGRQLLAALHERALAAGIHRFRATMLATNRGAIALTKRLGPEVEATRHGGILELTGDWAR
jgi:RimJ/RimL family protein N-acetyltransferase